MVLDLGEPKVGLVQMAKRTIPPSAGNRIAVPINERHGIEFQQLKLPFENQVPAHSHIDACSKLPDNQGIAAIMSR
jgi:hypothetical protein